MALSTTQYGYIIDPMVPFTDDKGKTIKNGFVRVFVAGSSTPVVTYRNFDGATNQVLIELDNSGRTKTSVIGSKGLTYKVCVYDQLHSQESPILTVDKVPVIGTNITAGAGATVITGLDGLTTKPNGFVDASVVGTDGYVALDHTLVTDDLDTDAKVTAVEDDRYVPLLNEDVNDHDSKMALGRLWQWVLGKIKSLSTTITSFRTGDVIPVDGPSGTAKMAKDDLLKVTAENVAPSISRAEVLGKFDCSEAANTLQVNGVYLRPTGVFSDNYYHKCYYVEVLAGEKFFVSKAESVDYCRIGFSSDIPAVEGSCSLVADIHDSSVSQLVEVTSDCFLVIGVALSTTGLTIYKLITSAEYTDSKLSLKSDLRQTYVKQSATFGQGWVETTTTQVENPTIDYDTEPTYLYTRITSGFTPGEKIYISTKLPGDYRCGIAFYSSTARTGAYWDSGEILDKKEFTIPADTVEIRINGFSSNPPEWFKNGTPEDLDTYGKSVDSDLAFKKFVIDNSLDRIRDLQYSKKFKPFTGGVVAFVFDDSKPDVDQIASLFATKGKACCFAAIPSYLNEFASQGGSILDALLTAQSNGCEILTHGLIPLNSTSTDEQVYNTMVGEKQKLVNFGFKVNGIIEIGGSGYDTFDYSRGYDYLREFYSYSDGYGKNLGMSQYYLNNRQWLTSTTSTNRAIIDDAKANNKFVLVSSHGVAITGGIGLSVLEDVLDYAIAQNVEILTIRKVMAEYCDYN